MRGSYTSIGQYILPKAVQFRAIAFAPLLFKCAGTTPLGFALLFPIVNVHLLSNIGINRTFIQTAEVLCDLLKLVKSNSSDLPHGLPLYVSQRIRCKTFTFWTSYQADWSKGQMSKTSGSRQINWSQKTEIVNKASESSRHLPNIQE